MHCELSDFIASARPQAAALPHVVLLHASAGSARQWKALTAMLAGRAQVHAIDLHGHGTRAPWSGARPFSLADDAALVVDLLERLGSAQLVGHSYGGAVALKAASLAPQRVRGLLAYEPVMFGWLQQAGRDAGLATIERVAAAIQVHVDGGALRDAARVFIDFWSGAGTWAAMPAERQAPIGAGMPSIALQFDALLHEPLRADALARLRLPMCFLTGTATVAPMLAMAAHLSARLPDARHEQLPGLAHMGPVTHAQQVNERLLAWLLPRLARQRRLAQALAGAASRRPVPISA